MPELSPFAGVRYSTPEKLKDLTCPPYDVISPEEQARLYERDPHNAVRLELPRGEGGDDERTRYESAARTFDQWLRDGDLRRDEDDAFYVYRQDFVDPEGIARRVVGCIGALRLEPFGAGSGVLPHERTMPGPKKDRLSLLRACPVNVSPIYAIYRAGGSLRPFYDGLEGRPTAGRFQDDDGILHRLWVISAPAEVDLLASALASGPLVIADGHHRYETALEYHAERAAAGADGGHAAIMCLCVDADSEELVVLPYNRAIRSRATATAVAQRLERWGAVPASDPPGALAAAQGDHPFVALTADGALAFSVSDEDVAAVVGERHRAWRDLDVVALHEVVLPALFPEGIEELTFSKDPAEIARLVREEGWTAGMLLRALGAPDIVDVAQSGERMPQKASYFWPKAVTGLVFRPL